jgi:hypothetical protein
MAANNDILPLHYEHDDDSHSEYSFELDSLDSGYNNPPQTHTVLTTLYSAIFPILIYTVTIIIAAYLIVQAMEAVSFVLSHNTGIAQKVVWVLFLPLVATFAGIVVDVIFDAEMGFGQAQFPRWLQEW